MDGQDSDAEISGPPPPLPAGEDLREDLLAGEPPILGGRSLFPGGDTKGVSQDSGGAKPVSELMSGIAGFATKLSESLNTMLKDLIKLEIATYVSEELDEEVIREPAKKGHLLALTRMKPDGDIESLLPTRDGHIDERLWRVHLDMVERAQSHRVQLIRALTEAATGLFLALK